MQSIVCALEFCFYFNTPIIKFMNIKRIIKPDI